SPPSSFGPRVRKTKGRAAESTRSCTNLSSFEVLTWLFVMMSEHMIMQGIEISPIDEVGLIPARSKHCLRKDASFSSDAIGLLQTPTCKSNFSFLNHPISSKDGKTSRRS